MDVRIGWSLSLAGRPDRTRTALIHLGLGLNQAILDFSQELDVE